jgi:hypothetical protein
MSIQWCSTNRSSRIQHSPQHSPRYETHGVSTITKDCRSSMIFGPVVPQDAESSPAAVTCRRWGIGSSWIHPFLRDEKTEGMEVPVKSEHPKNIRRFHAAYLEEIFRKSWVYK